MAFMQWLRETLESAQRVVIMAKKPSPEKYKQVVMVTGASILFLGLMGAVIKFTNILIRNAFLK